jgi:hypothetical protein
VAAHSCFAIFTTERASSSESNRPKKTLLRSLGELSGVSLAVALDRLFLCSGRMAGTMSWAIHLPPMVYDPVFVTEETEAGPAASR